MKLVLCLLFLASTTTAMRVAASDSEASTPRHRLELRQDGTVWASGANEHGQLGEGSRTSRGAPVQVVDLSEVAAVAVGERHSVALKRDGSVWSWGDNSRGQLGDNTRAERTKPVRVVFLDGVAAIECGRLHCTARKHDGSVWRWGAGAGTDVADDSLIPSPIRGPDSLLSR